MDPTLLHKQLKENATDLDEFYKDLGNWRKDMADKDKATSKHVLPSDNELEIKENKRKTSAVEKPVIKPLTRPIEKAGLEPNKVRSRFTDYSAWEKFDADAECEKMDYSENEESELSDECDEANREEAFVQKEKGNQFVKQKNWVQAVECYTKAIKCYSYDPIFYANRGLCYLKMQNYIRAEEDCTTSLTLDDTYVKAYQRRAAARRAINKLEEAQEDLVVVLKLEPKNSESFKEMISLRQQIQEGSKSTQRPISKFTASRQRNINAPKPQVVTKQVKEQKQAINLEKESDKIIVKAVNKPIRLRSTKPLKRISIQEASDADTRIEQLPKQNQTILRTDDLKVIERKQAIPETPQDAVPHISKTKKNETNMNMTNNVSNISELYEPKNSVQFFSQWKHLKTQDQKYALLKLFKPEKLVEIFQESMESLIFSEFLEILAKYFIVKKDPVFIFLNCLSQIRRFSTLTMFMTGHDKNYLCMLFDHIEKFEKYSKDEIDVLMKKYEI